MQIIFIIVQLFIIITFIVTLAIIISPKLRGKIMSRQIKAMKYMVDESKKDIENISINMANASKEGITITSKAIKKGFENENIFCKHCGYKIDADSNFCKKCGQKQ